MGSHGIVQPSPLLDEDDSLGQCVEDLSVQELVSELAVEALVVAVLPRTARLYVERLDTDSAQPPPNQLCCELRPVVRTQMLGWTVASKEIGENLDNIMGSSPSSDLDRQALPRVLVEHGQQLQRSTVVGARAHEVVGPDMVLVSWPESDARTIIEPQSAPFRLPPGHFEPLLPPDPLHTLVVHLPALDTQQVRDLPISVPAEPTRQSHHVRA